VDENSRNGAPFYEASALVAQFKHQDDKAEAEWSEALRLQPRTNRSSFNWCAATPCERSRTARCGEAMLTGLRSGPGQRSAQLAH